MRWEAERSRQEAGGTSQNRPEGKPPLMTSTRLKIYRGPETETDQDTAATVTVSVDEVLPLLADAIEKQRTWLRDFEDDEITLSADLYEVLLAYQYFRRPSA